MRKGRVEPRRPVDVPPQFAPPELDFKFPISQPSAQKQTPPSPSPYSPPSGPNPHPGRGRGRGFSSKPRGSGPARSNRGDVREQARVSNNGGDGYQGNDSPQGQPNAPRGRGGQHGRGRGGNGGSAETYSRRLKERFGDGHNQRKLSDRKRQF